MRTASFETDTDRARKKLSTFDKEVAAVSRSVGVGLSAAAVAAAAGITELVRSQIDTIDQFNDLADASGATVEKISALDDIARRTGADFDTVQVSLLKLNSVLKDADADSGAAQALRSIGLNADELRKADPADALLKVATGLSQFADGGAKARIMAELFGKSSKELAGFLKDLAEQGVLTTKVTTEQAAEVDKLNKQIAELSANATNAARGLATELVPSLNKLFEGFKRGGIRGFGDEIGEMLGLGKEYYAARTLKILSDDVELLRLRLATQVKGPGRTALQSELDERIAEMQAQEAALRKLQGPSGRGVVNPPFVPGSMELRPDPEESTGQPKVKGAPPSFTDFNARMGEALGRLIDESTPAKLAEVNAQLTRLNELERVGLDSAIVSEVRAKLFEQLPAKIEPAVEAFRRLEIASHGAVSAEALQAEDERAARIRESVKALGEGNQALREEIEIISGGIEAQRAREAAKRRNIIADKEGYLALRAHQGAKDDELGRLRDELALLKERDGLIAGRDTAAEVAREAADIRRTTESALGDTFSKVLSGDFKSIGQMWKQLLTRMVAEAAAAQVTKALFGDGGTGGGGWSHGGTGGSSSGWLAAILKLVFSEKGNAFGPAGLIPFANGGVVDQPTMFTFGGGRLGVMGEAGKEAVMPLRRGRDGKLGVAMYGSGAGGGGVNITQHITVEAGASRNEVMIAAKTAKDAAVAEILEMQRRGRWTGG